MGSVSRRSQYNVIALSREVDKRSTGMVLMVGEPQRLQTLKEHFPGRSGVFFIEYSDLSADILRALQPTAVVAPAISAHFDCLDLAEFLSLSEYKGAFRIFAQDIPKPDIIRREVRQYYPALNFEVLKTEAPASKELLH